MVSYRRSGLGKQRFYENSVFLPPYSDGIAEEQVYSLYSDVYMFSVAMYIYEMKRGG